MNRDNRGPIVPRRQKCWSVQSRSVFNRSPAAEMLERTVTIGVLSFLHGRNVGVYSHDWVLISIFQKKFRGKVTIAGFAYIQIKIILNIYFGFSFLIP